jgi:hypothetical protein
VRTGFETLNMSHKDLSSLANALAEVYKAAATSGVTTAELLLNNTESTEILAL